MDSAPGACSFIRPDPDNLTQETPEEPALQEVRLYGSSVWREEPIGGEPLYFVGLKKPAIVHEGGLLITANDGVSVSLNIYAFQFNQKIIQAFLE